MSEKQELEARIKELEYDNERLKNQNDVYRFGREEMPQWESPIESLLRRKEWLEREIESFIEQKTALSKEIDSLQAIRRREAELASEALDLDKQVTSLNQEVDALRKQRDSQFSNTLSLLKKLLTSYRYEDGTFIFKENEGSSLSESDVTRLIVRSLRS